MMESQLCIKPGPHLLHLFIKIQNQTLFPISRGMPLSPTSAFRGLAAALAPTATENDVEPLMRQIAALTLYNQEGSNILYRDPFGNQDIAEAVYRWDDRPYDQIFRTGLLARPRGATRPEDYYNLERHINGGGAPGEAAPTDGSVFVSTSRLVGYRPNLRYNVIIYRYEIFAPGGIETVETLGRRHNHANQGEIAFVGEINRQYIRTARAYVVLGPGPGERFAAYAPYGNELYHNDDFNPNPNMQPLRLRNARCPRGGVVINVPFPGNRDKRDTSRTARPYVDQICEEGHGVECAFNHNSKEEAFMFTGDQCFQISYAPGTTNDRIIKGPMSIGDFFPSLAYTIFASGVDAAFTPHADNEVYMFRNNKYVLLNFASGKVIGEPKRITDGFRSLKTTVFEHGIDAAFASHTKNEAYIFKGNQYARIYIAPGKTNDYLLNPPQRIASGFISLRGTVFENGLDSAFRAKKTNEAYIFKGDEYALINYAPGTTMDYIIYHVAPIKDGFHSLRGIIPSYPCGM